MRESVGGASLFTIVIVLLLLFTGYFCISLNYTAAYKVSDSIINQIVTDEGVNLENLTRVLSEAGYSSSGVCEDGWTAIKLGTHDSISFSNEGNYCVKRVHVASTNESTPDIYYYRIKVFYRIEVPILSNLNFNVQVDSPNIYTPNDDITIITVEG